MRIAFYAPMKALDHPVPSGDRTMARQLVAALVSRGHLVTTGCALQTRDPQGDPDRQEELRGLGIEAATLFAKQVEARTLERPDLWLTYHCYYKAPDPVGPRVAELLRIPYVLAEASLANKRAKGPWALNHTLTLAALDQAARIISFNPADNEALGQYNKIRTLAPFMDIRAFLAGAGSQKKHKKPDPPLLVTTAMMRPGDKLASFQLLALALARLVDRPWRLEVIGDGPARPTVEAAFAPLAPSVTFLGALERPSLAAKYRRADLFVWPAINEAYGLAMLEAQAAGLPVVAGRFGGVGAVVQDGKTGLLTPPHDVAAFAQAVGDLLAQPQRLEAMSLAAERQTRRAHDLPVVAQALDEILRELVA